MKKLAIIGECMIEFSGKLFGEMKQSYGGDTLNTAVYFARVTPQDRAEVSYISVLGTDKLSQSMLMQWQSEKINTELVLRDEKRQPGLYLIQLDSNGERTFLYWRAQSAARYLLQHNNINQVLSSLREMDMIYLTGISLAILPPNDRTLLIKSLIKLAQQGVEIAFDSNYRPALWESTSAVKEVYRQLYPFLSLALVTFDDEALLWQDMNKQETIKRLVESGVKNVVVKLGKEGAYFHCFTGEERLVTTQEVSKVVDTTSAGDSFNAAFLNGYLQGKSFEICCQQGNQLANVVIQHQGAIIDKFNTTYLRHKFNSEIGYGI